MTVIERTELEALPSRYRAQFVNSLSGYKSANLVGSANPQGQPNLALVSSVVHLGADPALLAHVTRPHTVPRHTLENIEATGVYTYNAVTCQMVPQAHHSAAKFAREVSEFEHVGLTPEYHPNFAAPAVVESPLSIGMELLELVPIKHNGTLLVIGQIRWVKYPQAALHSDGHLDISKLDLTAISGLDHYHSIASMGRLSYPEVEHPPTPLKLDKLP